MTVGNENAAQDLYGLGVRVGFYMQAFAMILYLYGDEKNYGKGLKIASGSMSTSVLTSWFIHATQAKFSPCEALVVLLFLINLSFPAKITLLNPRTIVGETVGLVALMMNEIGICTALIWLFSSLVFDLPLMETPNVIYRGISLSGWFRWVALGYCIVDALTSLIFLKKMARLVRIAWRCYTSHDSDITDKDCDKVTGIVQWSEERTLLKTMLWLVFAFNTITVETTIHWNHLSPSTDLQAPGQLIPLATGAILLIDSGFVAGRKRVPRSIQCVSEAVSRLNPSDAIPILRPRIGVDLSWCVNILSRLLQRQATDATKSEQV